MKDGNVLETFTSKKEKIKIKNPKDANIIAPTMYKLMLSHIFEHSYGLLLYYLNFSIIFVNEFEDLSLGKRT